MRITHYSYAMHVGGLHVLHDDIYLRELLLRHTHYVRVTCQQAGYYGVCKVHRHIGWRDMEDRTPSEADSRGRILLLQFEQITSSAEERKSHHIRIGTRCGIAHQCLGQRIQFLDHCLVKRHYRSFVQRLRRAMQPFYVVDLHHIHVCNNG